MGLFYRAMERADAEAAGAAKPETSPAPERAAAPRTWTEAAAVDLAGFPLGGNARPAPAPAPELAPRRGVRLRPPLWESALQSAGTGKRRHAASVIALEQSRMLRMRVLEAMRARGLQTLLISSALAQEGKSTVAAALALQISSLREQRVLLVDADLRRAGLSELLEPAPERGLADFLRGRATLDELVLDVDPYLAVLPTQPQAEAAAELLASERMAEMLRWAQQRFEWVLLDSAPVGPVADSRILARLAGGVLLVVRSETSAFAEVEAAARSLQPYLLGTVLNGSRHVKQSHYGYGYPEGGRKSQQLGETA